MPFFLVVVSLLCGTSHSAVTDAEDIATLEHAIAQTPPLPDWSQFFPALPSLGRRVQIASPCCGIHGTVQAMVAMNVGADSCNTFDLDDSYRTLLSETLQSAGMNMENMALHLGKVLGDLMRVPVRALKTPVDILMAGPPCPPWAGQGKHQGTQDIRAEVFFQILVWTFYFIRCGCLLAVCLENVYMDLHWLVLPLREPEGHI